MATAKGLTADLLAARREGLSYAAIGERFGITKQSAWERIDRAEKAARAAKPGHPDDTSATPEKMVEIARRIVDGLPEDLQKALAGENHGFRINVWNVPYGYGWWLGINDRRFHVSQRYIDRVGFEQAIRSILTRETILPAETIAHDNGRFTADTGVSFHTLPPGYTADLGTVDTASDGDVIAIVERPITEQESVSLFPRPSFVAEVYYRHGLDEVRKRWPGVDKDDLDAALRVGLMITKPPADDLPKGWGVRIAGAISRLFGGRS